MSFILLPICYFLQNGMDPDDLGLMLVGGAVLILMIRVTRHAVRVVSIHLMTPTTDLYLNIFVGGALDLEGGGLADVEDLIDRNPDDLTTDPET